MPTAQHKIDQIISQNRMQDVNASMIGTSLTDLKAGSSKIETGFRSLFWKVDQIDANVNDLYSDFKNMYRCFQPNQNGSACYTRRNRANEKTKT
jgi:hypothetical protein